VGLVQVLSRGAVVEIKLSRPSARNALSIALLDELDAAVDGLQQDALARAVLLHADGGHFCAGADLGEVAALDAAAARERDYIGSSARLAACALPVICAVEGVALGGGCELVEMSDIVIAGDSARFGHPELTMGTMPGAGGVQRLVRAIGKARALDVLLTGRFLSAGEAMAAGLVSRVCAAGQALELARQVAGAVAAMPAEAARAIKRDAAAAFELPLAEGLALEKALFHATLGSAELRSRVAAFLARSARG
jgi:enoyl-CoA hydratase